MCWEVVHGEDTPNRNCLQKPCSTDPTQTYVYPTCHCIRKKQPKQRQTEQICEASNTWKALPSIHKLSHIWSQVDVFDSYVTTVNYHSSWIYVQLDYKVSSYYVETCLTVKLCLNHGDLMTSWLKRPLTTTLSHTLSPSVCNNQALIHTDWTEYQMHYMTAEKKRNKASWNHQITV